MDGDASHGAVADATVSGTWSGGFSGTGLCITGASGQCSVTSGKIPRKQKNMTFAVDSVTHNPSLTYVAGDNHVTWITVFKP